ASRDRRRRPVVLASTGLGGLAVGVAITLGWLALRPEPSRPLERLSITLPHRANEMGRSNVLDVSADGRRLLYNAIGEDQIQLFVRAVDQREPRSLPGTEDAFVAGLSPDGEWAAFYSPSALKRVSLRGGPSTTIAEVSSVSALSWCDDGSIYYTVWNGGLMRVGENGGEAEILVAAADHGDPIYRGVEVLPGCEVVLFVSSKSFQTGSSINVFDRRTGQSSRLVESGSSPRFVRPGHLLFVRDSTLMAAPFDSARARLTGQPVPVVENVRTTFDLSSVDVSDAGVLFHVGGGLQEAGVVFQALRATGELEPLSARSALMGRTRLAPDGRRIAAVLLPEADRVDPSIWILDIERDQLTVLTTEPGSHRMPCWSRDGSFIYYVSDAETPGEATVVSRRSADGGEPEIMLTTMVPSQLLDVLPDDRGVLIAQKQEPDREDDLMIIRFGETPAAEPWLATAADEDSARISPDGRWVAYESAESGEDEIYVRPLEGSGARWAVSLDGGRDPFWSADGRILYFIEERSGSSTVMAAEVTSGSPGPDSVETGPFRTAVPTRWAVLSPLVRSWLIEAFPDGERLMVTGPITEQRDDPLEILVTRNFVKELERVARPSPR
ncbi:MAG: hypothetical protein ACYTJ0_18030, partial [Planctomycetota bacterium]